MHNISRVYAVFGGYYSDWYCVGYFTNREEAEKYCIKYGNDECYVEELKDLTNKHDVSDVTLKYEHEVCFDFKDKQWIMRDEPTRYTCYSDNQLRYNFVQDSGTFSVQPWISFQINLIENNRKKAEKIAQDYLYELIYESHRSDNSISSQVIDSLNIEFRNRMRNNK